jgi:hypothetical protein
VAVEDVVAVRAQLVLADACLDERCTCERGKTSREISARRFDPVRARDALAARRVELRAGLVVAHLEAAALGARIP